MVFLGRLLLNRSKLNVKCMDPTWKRRRIFSLTAHFFGRSKNVYSIAVRSAHRALHRSTLNRPIREKYIEELYKTRLNAACGELDTNSEELLTTLSIANIAIDLKALQELAIYEPRTFRSLAMLAKFKYAEKGFQNHLGTEPPPGVVTRGMI